MIYFYIYFNQFGNVLECYEETSALLSPYYTGQLCRQFVRLFCWPTDLEHPHARRSVFIETLYPIITTNPLLPSAAYLRRSAKSFDFNLRRYHKKSYGCPDYKSVDQKNLS